MIYPIFRRAGGKGVRAEAAADFGSKRYNSVRRRLIYSNIKLC